MSESVLLADAARVRGCFVMPHHMIAEKFSLIESIWELSVCEPCEHKSNETEIELCSGIAEGSLKVFD